METKNKEYMTPKDLQQVTGIGINKCKKILAEIKQEMIERGEFVPYERKLYIPTKLIRKKMNI